MSKNIKLATVSFTVALALALLGVLFIGLPAVVGAQGPDGGISAQALVGTAFTYQGRLNDGGSPANGTYDFLFYMYDAQSGGNFLSNYGVPDLTVTDGYFTVQLDFGSSAFTGEARWLEIWVKEDSQTNYTTLSPRVALTAVPYAHSLRPGAVISGSTLTNLFVQNTGQGTSFPIAAIIGYASGSGGTNYGIYGSSASPTGAGVYGESDQGNGVYGESDWGYGVYSEGDAHIEGDLTWKPITGYVSVSAAAFRPVSQTLQYSNWGGSLSPDDISSLYYYASVQLPHGATVTQMTYYWYDNVTANAICRLYRNPMDYITGEPMASVESGSGGIGSSSDDTIDYAIIDNSQYAYYLGWLNMDVNVSGRGVVIEYTFTRPY